MCFFFFFSSRRRHTRLTCVWSSDVCSSDLEICRRLREWSAMPLILLSAVCDEEQQVRAFEAGADDYVTKPFRPRELVARLLANLRRADPGGDEPCVNLGGLEVNLAARVVRRDG